VLQAIQCLDKQTFALEAIQKFARLTNTPAKGALALIEITAAETLRELAPEIEAIKNNAMNADKYQSGDFVGGY
jgi:DNA-binding transcriptional MerR regulator